MKKLILLILFMTFGILSNAQVFAIINDKDGFVNVRKSPGVNSSIIGKLYTDQLFAYDGNANNKSTWVQIFRQNEDNTYFLEGYVSRNKILELSSLKKIDKIKFYKDSCTAYNDSLSIVVKSAPFNPKKHKLQYNKPGKNELAILMKVDGKNVWGTDGEIPKRDISLKVTKLGVPIIIPQSAYNDLHEPNFNSDNFNIYSNKNTIYIQMDNSDGAGGYSIIWVIKNDKYNGRYIGTM